MESGKILDEELLKKGKRHGFSDAQIATLGTVTEEEIRKKRTSWGIIPSVKRIDTMAGEFPAKTFYLYMTYAALSSDYAPDSSDSTIAVLGGGPYAIGTSVEFDWCAVHTVKTARACGKKTIMINCNPETVSTDFDESDVLYFEELSYERVMDIFDSSQYPPSSSVS